MKKFHHFSLLTACCLLLTALLSAQSPKVILMIGDGMGPGVIGLGKYYNDFVLKKPELNLVKLMNRADTKIAIVTTYSASHLVTDSAAAATAIACGVKTYNSAIGVDEKGGPLKSLVDIAQKNNLMTGLVTTCEAVDATPAGFSANVLERANKEEIAAQQLDRKINLIFGGGARYYETIDIPSTGYKVIYDKKDLKKLPTMKSDYVLGIFNQNNMNFAKDRNPQEPSLPEMTKAALDFLSKSKKGFFLMVEGGRIDHAAHDNSVEDLLKDFLEFDETIGVILDFKSQNPETVVLVTADHDTGGVAITQKSKDYEYPTVEELKNLKGIYWLSKQHTSVPVILAISSPDTSDVKGFIDNVEINKIISSRLTVKQ